MCAVSMVNDHYNHLATNVPQPWLWNQALPPSLPWTNESFSDLKDILKRLEQLDKKLGLANCEDPKKARWMKAVEKRLKQLEKVKP